MCSVGGEAEAQTEGGKQGLNSLPASSRPGEVAQPRVLRSPGL